MNLPILHLKKSEERRLLAGHLWVFSNEIDNQKSPIKNFQIGELVEVISSANKSLGIGYVNPHTLLAARILSRNPKILIDEEFLAQRIASALELRASLITEPFYRLIYGESDGLPGLVVDRFGEILVVQLNTAGMENLKTQIVRALVGALNPAGILLRNDSSAREIEGLKRYVEVAYGNIPEKIYFAENTVQFCVDVRHGQKTGWFYDQRLNRARLAPYVKDKKVLDVFCYGGGFGVQSAAFGARQVTCIDASEFALKQVMENAGINSVENKISCECGDAFDVLQAMRAGKELFDVIILDPPAFIKRQKDIVVGSRAYLNLHKSAFELLNAGGVLFSMSCSQHLSSEMLLNIIRQASLHCHNITAIIEHLHQAQDHPIHPAIAETNYLKGFCVKKYA